MVNYMQIKINNSFFFQSNTEFRFVKNIYERTIDEFTGFKCYYARTVLIRN